MTIFFSSEFFFHSIRWPDRRLPPLDGQIGNLVVNHEEKKEK